MGPAMYVWIRTANMIWPKPGIRYSLSKAITEQFTVDPVLICTFLFVMSLLEKKTVEEAEEEVSHHLHTFKRILVWFLCFCLQHFGSRFLLLLGGALYLLHF